MYRCKVIMTFSFVYVLIQSISSDYIYLERSGPYAKIHSFLLHFDIPIEILEMLKIFFVGKQFSDIRHSWDIWHGAKSLGKKLCVL